MQKRKCKVMPRKPLTPCRYRGCPNLCEGSYCDEHKTLARREYNRYRRDPQTNKRYGASWRKIRSMYVKAHPFCEKCAEDGRLVPVEEVHHILPLVEGGTNEFINLMSLCHACHNSIHNTMGRKRD